jgi:hypothetical protein
MVMNIQRSPNIFLNQEIEKPLHPTRICMNEDPGKRPSFDMIIPILEKMKK